MTIKIAVVDDHPLLIKGSAECFSIIADIEVTDTYQEGGALLAGLAKRQPDVLLLDVQMKGLGGDDLVPLVRKEYPQIRIVVLTNMEHEYYIKTLIGRGAEGYVLKSSDELVLTAAIRTVFSGTVYVDPAIAHLVHQNSSQTLRQSVLTRREKEILELIAREYSSNEIASALFLSKRTVDNHRTNLLLKMGVKNSASLVRKSIELGIIK